MKAVVRTEQSFGMTRRLGYDSDLRNRPASGDAMVDRTTFTGK